MAKKRQDTWPPKPDVMFRFTANMRELCDSGQHPFDCVELSQEKYHKDKFNNGDSIKCQFSGFRINRTKRARNCLVWLAFDMPRGCNRRKLLKRIRRMGKLVVTSNYYHTPRDSFRVKLCPNQGMRPNAPLERLIGYD